MKFDDLKAEAYEANMQLPALGLVLFTFGNASAIDRDKGIFAIKPSGVPYADLRPDDMVLVDLEGKVVSGRLRPSSDTETHAVLYRQWSTLGGIVHTHSTYATSWAQTQLDIPILGTTHADHLTVDIPCAPVMDDEMIQGNYEHETGFQILNDFKRRDYLPEEVEMVLVANHAPFTWGKTVAKAVYNSAVLEQIAQMAWIAHSVRPDVPRLKDALIRKHYARKHGKNAYYGQE
ncbi:MAG TPA: L-ribulose-5-phosphate 4-epimerase [Saprospiraceae bacterium]|nr:L-ribulose-5-phosphate 4-epimerase [Saprospiraceae bacterium]